jgi:hypothetical protein
MKYICYNLFNKVNPLLSTISKQQILELQDIFLTNGIHHIQVSSSSEGRLLVQTFLQALRCFCAIGCLTNNKIPLQDGVFDIRNFLDIYGYSITKNNSEIDRFFLEEFECDFLWIETTSNNYWYSHFEQKIHDLGIDQHMPIIIISALQ